MRRLPELRAPWLALLAVLAGVLALAPPASAAGERPFIYVVVIDALDGDKVEAGTAPFIASLLDGQGASATYYPRSRSVMPAVTNSNHVAMMSGAYAGRSGIAGNAFALYSPLADEDSCVRTGPLDLRTLPTETSGESLTCPRKQFTFEAIKRQAGPNRPITAAIFGKPKLGRIFAGRNVNPARRDVDHLWAPCTSEPDDDDYCESVTTNPATGYTTDDVVMDETIRTIQRGVVAGGQRQRPRLTFVNLPDVDSAGHAAGTGGLYDAAIVRADGEVERLVETLRDEEIWNRSVLMLVSDHSMDNTPVKVTLTNSFEAAGIPDGAYLPVNGEFGANGSAEHVYLADRRSPSRHGLLRRMREAALDTPGVGEALYRRRNPRDGGRLHTIAAEKPGWRLNGPRTGDLFATTEPNFAFSDPEPSSNPIPGGHGGPQTRDNFLALAGGGDRFVRQGTVEGEGRRAHPVNVDLAPTVMRLLGLAAPADNRGRVLSRALRAGALSR